MIGAAAPASAHATLVSTDPAEGAVLATAPDQVTFTFDESVQLVPDGLQAFDAAGDPVEIKGSASGAEVTGDLPSGLDDGTYVVTWRVVSADGHPVAGSLTFHVGAPSPRVEPPKVAGSDPGALQTIQAIVHGLNYLGLLIAGGLAVFLGWMARGVRLADAGRRRIVRIQRGATVLALVTVWASVPIAGAYQRGAGTGGIIDSASLEPSLVREDLLVLALQAIGLAVAWWSIPRRQAATATPLLATTLATALAVWSPALVGHTRAYQPSALLVVTDALHLSAGAVWLGGLTGLALALPGIAGRPRDAAQLLTRFSSLAAALLGLVAASGLLMAWRIIGSWSRLVEETYGRLLLVKIGIVLLVAAVAAWNRLRLLPQVTTGIGHDGPRRGSGLVRRAVLAEAAGLVAVLAVTGFLTQKPPGGEGPGQPTTADTGVASTIVGQELKVLAVLDAGPGLQRQITVQVQDLAGEPVDTDGAPAVALRSADGAVDLGEVPTRPAASGTYVADVTFPKAGAWKAQVSVRIDEFTSPVTTLDLTVDQ